ncbi:MAG: hypothetical protein HKN59_09700 [Gammaproteobacteria bacterium]|nr:hypothetical protein [Gammaproteobacteria bacterium]
MSRSVYLRTAAVFLLLVSGACSRGGEVPVAAVEADDNGTGEAETYAADSLAAPPDVAGVPADADITASGLASRLLVAGSGSEHPGPESSVEVHYTGWTTDGQMFDSSRKRGKTAVFPLNRVIAGWTEGLQLMVVGEQRRFWIPAELAYANSSRPGAPQGMLVFDVELIDIKD